ncbi:MAG: YlmC/YmxH family sporulation protein [Clostridia bacterium]|nr:YlmC/YmxH family sporulation protein [Clostridia bacterium]
MNCSITELCEKDVIEITGGTVLGRISDIEFDPQSGRITNLIIFGRQKMFGFGKTNDDIRFTWQDISVIGDDTILICCEIKPHREKPKGNPVKSLFNPQ